MPTEDDTLLYEDDELDRNACMLPLVRFIEKASGLYKQGGLPDRRVSPGIYCNQYVHGSWAIVLLICVRGMTKSGSQLDSAPRLRASAAAPV